MHIFVSYSDSAVTVKRGQGLNCKEDFFLEILFSKVHFWVLGSLVIEGCVFGSARRLENLRDVSELQVAKSIPS